MDIAFRNNRRNNLLYRIPLLLTEDDTNTIDKAIKYFESIKDLSEDQLDSNFIMNLLPRRKMGRGLITVFTRWFYDVKGLKIDHKIPPYKWRSKLYKELETQNITWVEPREKGAFLQSLAEKWDIDFQDISEIEAYLFGDHKINYKIRCRAETPQPKDIILRYNTDVVSYLFSKANSVSFTLSGNIISGGLIKTLIVNSKLWGIYTDITKNSDSTVFFEMIGPTELVGKGTKYGRQLYALFYSISPHLPKENFELTIAVKYYSQYFKVLLPITEIPSLLPISQAFSQSIKPPYDSKVEEEFAKQCKRRFPQWKIEREHVIIENNTIFIPDFKLKYRDITILIEIVGFWMERYLQKKIQKINRFKEVLPNLIILVDEKLNFPQLDVKTFLYGKEIPITKIRNYLKENYEKPLFERHLANLENQKEIILHKTKNVLLKTSICDNKCLSKILKTRAPKETLQACKLIFPDIVGQLNCVVLLQGILLFDIKFLQTIQPELSKLVPVKGISEEIVEEHFQHIEFEILNQILNYLGYAIRYETLLDVMIYPPKDDRVIIPEVL